ncbi:AI-2E family transporter [Kocuria salina]|nr:AI-2E family transporter [Kocuria salina]
MLLSATAVVVYGLIQLKLVVIPLLIALVLAAALNPLVASLRRHRVPGALATWIVFVAAIVVLGGVVTGAVLVAVILYFFLQDGARIWAFVLSRFHGETLEKLLTSGTTTLHVLGGYVRGTAVVALLEAVVIGVTLLVLRVPLALPLSVLIFLGGFIPIVGAALIGGVAVLVALVANGPVVALVVVAVVVATNQLDGRVLQPMVLGRALSLHPLVVLLALAAGGILSGVVGAVLAVPLTAVGWALIQIWFPNPRNPDVLSRPAARPGVRLKPPAPDAPVDG